MQEFEANKIIFIGEQDGAPERDLKNALGNLFRNNVYIEKAYLARVRYESSHDTGIALCLLGTPNELLLDEIGGIFQRMFSTDIYLDICFLDPEQHSQLGKVAQAFFIAGEKLPTTNN